VPARNKETSRRARVLRPVADADTGDSNAERAPVKRRNANCPPADSAAAERCPDGCPGCCLLWRERGLAQTQCAGRELLDGIDFQGVWPRASRDAI